MAIRTIAVILAACVMAGGTQASNQGQSAQDKPEVVKVAKGQDTSASAQSAGVDPAYRIGPARRIKN